MEENTAIKQEKKKMPKWAKIVIIVVVVLIFIGIAGGNDDNSSSENSSSNTKPKTTTRQERFSYEVTSEYDDTFSHYIEGTVTNNKDKDYSYVQIEFICYDKDGNNLGTAVDNTNNLLGNQTWKYKALGLFTNATVDHCDYHEITGW